MLWAQEEVEQQDSIFLLDPRSGKVRELPEPDLPKHNPALSPDGKLIAFIGPAHFGSQLFLYDSATDPSQTAHFQAGQHALADVCLKHRNIIRLESRSRERVVCDRPQSAIRREEEKVSGPVRPSHHCQSTISLSASI